MFLVVCGMVKFYLSVFFSGIVCGDAKMVDIVFSTSPSAGVADTEKALNFYKSIVNQLPLHNDNIHIGKRYTLSPCNAMFHYDRS